MLICTAQVGVALCSCFHVCKEENVLSFLELLSASSRRLHRSVSVCPFCPLCSSSEPGMLPISTALLMMHPSSTVRPSWSCNKWGHHPRYRTTCWERSQSGNNKRKCSTFAHQVWQHCVSLRCGKHSMLRSVRVLSLLLGTACRHLMQLRGQHTLPTR